MADIDESWVIPRIRPETDEMMYDRIIKEKLNGVYHG